MNDESQYKWIDDLRLVSMFSMLSQYHNQFNDEITEVGNIGIETYGYINRHPEYMHIYHRDSATKEQSLLSITFDKIQGNATEVNVVWRKQGERCEKSYQIDNKDITYKEFETLVSLLWIREVDELMNAFKEAYIKLFLDNNFDPYHLMSNRVWSLQSFGKDYMIRDFHKMDKIRKKLYKKDFQMEFLDYQQKPCARPADALSVKFYDLKHNVLTQLSLVSATRNTNHECRVIVDANITLELREIF